LLAGVDRLLRQGREGRCRAGHHLRHLRHGFRDLGIGGHGLHVVLPQVQVLFRQLVQVRLIGHGGFLVSARLAVWVRWAHYTVGPGVGETFIAAQQWTR
tara:strand:- start:1331 stop:1627 length:297 start_codon:yes stop_codon:yes gene_type:complete